MRLRMRVPRIGGKSPTHLTNYELSFTLSSFPRWVSYWCIGWQIYATKYCVEIEELFAQMMLLKFEIGVRMPGNKRYVNEYIEGCWQHVTAFTSAIERYDSPPPWLEEKFVGYAGEHSEGTPGEDSIRYRCCRDCVFDPPWRPHRRGKRLLSGP